MIIDGRKRAEDIYNELREKVNKLPSPPTLVVLSVGNHAASISYIRQKEKACEKVGVHFEHRNFPEHTTESQILEVIDALNTDPTVTAFIIQLPLPAHIDTAKVIDRIDPRKDADGFTKTRIGELFLGDDQGIVSCTPKGIKRLLDMEGIDLKGKRVTIVGRSNIVGKPLALICVNAGATVTVCNRSTKNLSDFTNTSDIIVCAAGQPNLLTRDMVQSGAVIIDVGFSMVDGKIRGDADFENLEPDCRITPVPGGVGPMTVAMLLENVLCIA